MRSAATREALDQTELSPASADDSLRLYSVGRPCCWQVERHFPPWLSLPGFWDAPPTPPALPCGGGVSVFVACVAFWANTCLDPAGLGDAGWPCAHTMSHVGVWFATPIMSV